MAKRIDPRYDPGFNGVLRSILDSEGFNGQVMDLVPYGGIFRRTTLDHILILKPGASPGVLGHRGHAEVKVKHLGSVVSIDPSQDSLEFTFQEGTGRARDKTRDRRILYSGGEGFTALPRESGSGFWHGFRNVSGEDNALRVTEKKDYPSRINANATLSVTW